MCAGLLPVFLGVAACREGSTGPGIPENRMDYTPFVDADKWPAFLDERAESLRKVIAAGKYER